MSKDEKKTATAPEDETAQTEKAPAKKSFRENKKLMTVMVIGAFLCVWSLFDGGDDADGNSNVKVLVIQDDTLRFTEAVPDEPVDEELQGIVTELRRLREVTARYTSEAEDAETAKSPSRKEEKRETGKDAP